MDNLKSLQEKFGEKIVCSNIDISEDSVIGKVRDAIFKIKEEPYILINNAAFSCMEETTIDDHFTTRKIIDINLSGAIGITNSVLGVIGENKIKIVNILSSVAYKGNINCIYAASKWGLRGYSESLKVKYQNTNVSVFNIVPCAMNTSYWDNKPKTIDKSKFASPEYVAGKIYEHITLLNEQKEDYKIPKEKNLTE